MVDMLDLGCGPFQKLEGSIGVDIKAASHVDVVHNLDVYPYPFEDNQFKPYCFQAIINIFIWALVR